MSRRKDSGSNGGHLVPREPAELAPQTTNVVGLEVANLVRNLPRGIYRSRFTVCRITFDAQGLEKTNEMISDHCFDFEIRPQALAAAEPQSKDGGP